MARRFDSGMLTLMTWNAAKQLGGHSDNLTSSERDKWFVFLDFLQQTKIDICTLQEVGTGGSKADETRIRSVLQAWSRSRKVDARIWLAGAAGWLGDKDVRRQGGAPAGLATVALGQWSRRGIATRRWADGRGLWVEFHEGAQCLALGNVLNRKRRL